MFTLKTPQNLKDPSKIPQNLQKPTQNLQNYGKKTQNLQKPSKTPKNLKIIQTSLNIRSRWFGKINRNDGDGRECQKIIDIASL